MAETETRFLSIPYLLLRAATAGGGLVGGLVQTFVFARILDPERFSIFILVGTLGIALWLSDIGLVKIIFVRLRSWLLGGAETGARIVWHATAIVILYFVLSLVATIACFFGALAFGSGVYGGLELALFFLFTAITLVWFALRNISLAVDDFIFFEVMEAIRRTLHVGFMLATLIGLSLMAFLVIANLIWIALFAVMIARLSRKGALQTTVAGFPGHLRSFFRDNRKEVVSGGTYAVNEYYLYNFAYALVPLAYGLGAPTIILDTLFKVIRGATVLYSAACDAMLPRQTRAHNDGDRRSIVLATWMAAGLASLPGIAICIALAFFSQPMFRILLGEVRGDAAGHREPDDRAADREPDPDRVELSPDPHRLFQGDRATEHVRESGGDAGDRDSDRGRCRSDRLHCRLYRGLCCQCVVLSRARRPRPVAKDAVSCENLRGSRA